MVDLVRSGRSAWFLGRELRSSARTIGLWVKQAKRDTGQGDGGQTSVEREVLSRLRSEGCVMNE
jgi:hypothetical protein